MKFLSCQLHQCQDSQGTIAGRNQWCGRAFLRWAVPVTHDRLAPTRRWRTPLLPSGRPNGKRPQGCCWDLMRLAAVRWTKGKFTGFKQAGPSRLLKRKGVGLLHRHRRKIIRVIPTPGISVLFRALLKQTELNFADIVATFACEKISGLTYTGDLDGVAVHVGRALLSLRASRHSASSLGMQCAGPSHQSASSNT